MRKIATFCVLIGASALAIARGHESIAVIRSGTSFGHCAGYCSDQIELRGIHGRSKQEARRYPNGTTPPPRRVKFQISPSRWSKLVALAQQATLSKEVEVIGCPDCDDGGAEWIEFEMTTGAKRRITFGYHDYPTKTLELGQNLAAIREDSRERIAPLLAPNKSRKPTNPARSGR